MSFARGLAQGLQGLPAALQRYEEREAEQQRQQLVSNLLSDTGGQPGQGGAPAGAGGDETLGQRLGQQVQQTNQAVQQTQRRQGALSVAEQIGQLSRIPKSMRGAQVEMLSQRMQQEFGRPMAPNLQKAFSKASDEEMRQLAENAQNAVASDPNITVDTLATMLTDEQQSFQALSKLMSKPQGPQVGVGADEQQGQTQRGQTATARGQQQPSQQRGSQLSGQQSQALNQRQAMNNARERNPVRQIDAAIADTRSRIDRVTQLPPDIQAQVLPSLQARVDNLEARREQVLERRGGEIINGRDVSPHFPEGTVLQRKPDGTMEILFEPERGDQNQTQRKIESLTREFVEQHDMDPERARELAEARVDGRLTVEMTDTGEVRLIDDAAAIAGDPNAATNIEIDFGDPPPAPEIPREDTLWAKATDAAGPRGTFYEITGRIPFTRQSWNEQVVSEARSNFRLFQNETARALANNPKFAVREIEALKAAIDIDPSFFGNPNALRTRLRSMQDFLERRQARFERMANDQRNDTSTRQDSRAKASFIDGIIGEIGVPSGPLFEGLETAEDVQAIPDEAWDDFLGNAVRPDLEYFIQNAGDDALRALPDRVLDEMTRRLERGR